MENKTKIKILERVSYGLFGIQVLLFLYCIISMCFFTKFTTADITVSIVCVLINGYFSHKSFKQMFIDDEHDINKEVCRQLELLMNREYEILKNLREEFSKYEGGQDD